jgi:di/tricarboxylate transporter
VTVFNGILYIVLACAFGIGTAMENSGVATGLATFLVDISIVLGGVYTCDLKLRLLNVESVFSLSLSISTDAGVYGAVYLATSLLSSILTNNASAALMYPIAMEAVDQTGTDRLKMAYMVMLAANDYMTSFGYTVQV